MTLFAAACGLALAGLLIWIDQPPEVTAALLAVLLLLAPAPRRLREPAAVALGVGLLGAAAFRWLGVLAVNLRRIPEWDFGAFWLHARLAVQGIDFYDRDRVREVAAALGASPAFLETGRFWNPPQSMLLFLPLGWISDPRQAYLIWFLVQLAAVAGSTILLARIFVRGGGVEGKVTVAAVVAALGATGVTLALGQTHFLILLLLLLWVGDRERLRGGLWLGLGVLLKPIALLLLLEPLVRKRWRVLVGVAMVALVSTALAFGIFGAEVMSGYVRRGAGPVPGELFTMPANQSLFGLLVRTGAIDGERPLGSPLYPAAALVLVSAVAYGIWRRPEASPESVLALLAATAFVVYPQTLDHYAVLLLPAILMLWRARSVAASSTAAIAVLLIAFVYRSPIVPLDLLAAAICAGGVLAWGFVQPPPTQARTAI